MGFPFEQGKSICNQTGYVKTERTGYCYIPSKYSMYIPSMMYSLLAMTFDTKTLNKIQRKADQAILTKLGVSKSFPQRVAFGLKDMCGMALLDMSVEQGI
jgi:hypothetical protein